MVKSMSAGFNPLSKDYEMRQFLGSLYPMYGKYDFNGHDLVLASPVF
jgi:hypothetical protein